MGAILTFQRTGAGQTAWTVDKDYLLTGIHTSGIGVLSRDINDNTTNYFTPTAGKVADLSIILGTNGTTFYPIPNMRLYKGEIIYYNSSGAGSVQLNVVDDPAELANLIAETPRK